MNEEKKVISAVCMLRKPNLGDIKLSRLVSRPVIRVELTIPYTEDTWAFVGAIAGQPVQVVASNSEIGMFDAESGEILNKKTVG